MGRSLSTTALTAASLTWNATCYTANTLVSVPKFFFDIAVSLPGEIFNYDVADYYDDSVAAFTKNLAGHVGITALLTFICPPIAVIYGLYTAKTYLGYGVTGVSELIYGQPNPRAADIQENDRFNDQFARQIDRARVQNPNGNIR